MTQRGRHDTIACPACGTGLSAATIVQDQTPDDATVQRGGRGRTVRIGAEDPYDGAWSLCIECLTPLRYVVNPALGIFQLRLLNDLETERWHSHQIAPMVHDGLLLGRLDPDNPPPPATRGDAHGPT